MPDVIAIDWSGRATGDSETIWLAHVRDGRLVDLDNGRTREDVVEEAIARAGASAVVGLDFAFSFPRWFCDRNGWAEGRDVWEAMRTDGESLLARCEPPFWGRPGRRRRSMGAPLRATDTGGAKSVFQIGGAGAVGTGSIRGMPLLPRFAEAGFAIWPFDPPAPRTVVEIYPRALTGPVVKRRAEARRAYLDLRFPGMPFRERAAGSEDAFDAAVSALVMAAHADELAALRTVAPGSDEAIEGAIWRPA
jgi:hypothetical protein